jgi:serine/threonine-protein kinase RsbW
MRVHSAKRSNVLPARNLSFISRQNGPAAIAVVLTKADTSEVGDIHLCIANRPENVAVVRQLLQGISDGLSLPNGLTDDIKTVVSEACNNVVLHAYDGQEGPMELELITHKSSLEMVVRDQGKGISPQESHTDQEMPGVGLAVIQAFSDRVEFRGELDNGTEVRMEFGMSPSFARDAGDPAAIQKIPAIHPIAAKEARVSLALGPTLRPVLTRLAVAMANLAGFSVNRLSDMQLVADAIGAHAPAVSDSGRLEVGLTIDKRELLLRVTSLRRGGGAQLVRNSWVDGLGQVIECLAKKVSVERTASKEVLVVLMNG